MINGKLQEFVCNVIAKGQIRYGDVRRLQRDYLADGITAREELELLISTNERIVRADRAWVQWLVASVAKFVGTPEVREDPIKEADIEWVRSVLAASTTSLGRRIARQIRRELERRPGIQSVNSDEAHPVRNPVIRHSAAPSIRSTRKRSASNDCSPRTAKRSHRGSAKLPARSRPPCLAVGHGVIPGAADLPGAGWCLAGYLPAVQRSHLINFQSSRVSLVLAPCR